MEQKKAFYLVGIHFLAKKDNAVFSQPLHLFIGGEGGTGKTRVAHAINFLFKSHDKYSWLRRTSYMGTAANKIDGSTLSSLIKDFPFLVGNKKKSNDDNDNNMKLRGDRLDDMKTKFDSVHYIILDEVSMLSSHLITKLHTRMQQAKGNDLDFGGVSIIFMGDFIQLPPVGGSSLYTPCNTKNGVIHAEGRRLWMDASQNVVILTENMRQKSDPKLAQVLGDMRNQDHSRVDEHYDLLKTRELTSMSNLPACFQHAPILTGTNAVRSAINFAKVKKLALINKVKVVVLLSKDSVGAKETALTTLEKNELWHLVEKDSTGNLIGMLPLVYNMPVLIKDNQAVELGICNGTLATFKRLIFDPDEPHFNVTNTSMTNQLHFIRKMPVCAIVEIDKPTFERLPGLAPGEFPIFPVRKFFKHISKGMIFIFMRNVITLIFRHSSVSDTTVAWIFPHCPRISRCHY